MHQLDGKLAAVFPLKNMGKIRKWATGAPNRIGLTNRDACTIACLEWNLPMMVIALERRNDKGTWNAIGYVCRGFRTVLLTDIWLFMSKATDLSVIAY